jgi:anti-sigma regulatory factor (Ser/Thr protein kinase)
MEHGGAALETNAATLRRQAATVTREAYLTAVDAMADDVEQVAAELVANAVRHGGNGPVRTEVAWVPGGVVVCVFDACTSPPVMREMDSEREDGRGLVLVDELTGSRWGYVLVPGGGKYVWAQLSLPAPRESAAPSLFAMPEEP